jgi:microcin C transport system ATP-binding protein
VIRALSDEVLVMRDGRFVEHGPGAQIFESPREPYTLALISAAFELELTDESPVWS